MLIESLNDHHLVQLQREVTREKSILDLYITNRPALVKSINTVPNISDHEGAIVVDSAITPVLNKKTQRTIHLFSKADWNNMRKEIELFSEKFINTHLDHTVNENWISIKNAIFSTIENHVPQRKVSTKKKHPWITTDLIRKSRKKHRMFKKSRLTKNPIHIEKYKKIQKEFPERNKECQNQLYKPNCLERPGRRKHQSILQIH